MPMFRREAFNVILQRENSQRQRMPLVSVWLCANIIFFPVALVRVEDLQPLPHSEDVYEWDNSEEAKIFRELLTSEADYVNDLVLVVTVFSHFQKMTSFLIKYCLASCI